MKCECCGTSIGEESRCVYCGMPVITVLGEGDINRAEAEKYRNNLVSKISGISVEAFTYTVKDNQFVDNGGTTIRIADGGECFNRLVRAEQDFVQVPEQGKRRFTVRYMFDGKPYSVSCEIDTPKTEGFWKIGVMLKDDLRLKVYAGTENQYTSAENIDLTLR